MTAIRRNMVWILAAFFSVLPSAKGDSLPLTVSLSKRETVRSLPQRVALSFPGERNFHLEAPQSEQWLNGASLRFSLYCPTGMPRSARALVWLKDRDDYWHQYLVPGMLTAGETNRLEIPFAANAGGWKAPGHSLAWHYRVRLHPQSVGVRVFCGETFTGACDLVSASLETAAPSGSPRIFRVRPLTEVPRVYECYELAFDLPDRYVCPFDPTCVDAGASVITPSGKTNTVSAFYYQPCYRLEDELNHPVEPDGRPEWRLRYCPREEGVYTLSLFVRDALGRGELTNAVTFTASPARQGARGFVRVSEKDRRYFAFDDGSFYFPVGHNTRSASDSRMDDKFPWIFRQDDGPVTYRRYFRRMAENGENWAEVWMSAWSLGLEWSEGISGYHGANDYHMGNAWELDGVLALAASYGIRVNLVLNYHGRISSWCDPEWHLHPYNKVTAGGWLTHAIAFFDDPRAMEMQRRFLRYTQARWGWDPTIFSYELCSEINLAGDKSNQRTNFETNVVDWCRSMGGYLHRIDPNRHLVTSHISIDYRTLNPAICNQPEMDYNAVDAYHFGAPERIATLCAETQNAGLPFAKPILITEFGGSPMAAGLQHLLTEQHIGIWSGACLPLAGIPMFWWWQVVDEHDLYPRYAALRAFVGNEDFRDPSAVRVNPVIGVQQGEKVSLSKKYAVVATASARTARGYLYPSPYPSRPEKASPVAEKLSITLAGMEQGVFRVEFFETEKGTVLRKFDLRAEKDGRLILPVPRFAPDCAFRLHLLGK